MGKSENFLQQTEGYFIMTHDFWLKQKDNEPLFKDIEWDKPEQKSIAGRLLIVGGTINGFSAVVKAHTIANETGAGEIKVAIPDILKKTLPQDFNDGIFLPTNVSGSLSKESEIELFSAADWSNGILLIGDSGQNSETAILYDKLLDSTSNWVTITRDVIDLLMNSADKLVSRKNTNLVLNFSQVQKLFSKVYYPKILTFSMQFTSFIESVHKFTITYPVTLTVLFSDKIIVANDGQVVSQEYKDMMSLVNGTLATKNATYLLWSPKKPLEAIATSWQK